MIQLELDDTDKKQFNDLQQSMAKGQQEVAMITSKQRVRETEKRRADLTLSELKDVDNSTSDGLRLSGLDFFHKYLFGRLHLLLRRVPRPLDDSFKTLVVDGGLGARR